MQQTITGLYLNHTNYGDTSVIVKLYTLQYGTVSFIIKGLKRKKGATALLQPFHYVELNSNFKPDRDLNFGNNIKLIRPSYSLTTDIRKSTVAIFLTDVMSKTLKESAPSEETYTVIELLIESYDKEEFMPLFHFYFLVQLIQLLGVLPDVGKNNSTDLLHKEKGLFEACAQPDNTYFNLETSLALKQIIGTKFAEIRELKWSKKTKNELLKNLVNYIEMQTEIREGSIVSHQILETIFND